MCSTASTTAWTMQTEFVSVTEMFIKVQHVTQMGKRHRLHFIEHRTFSDVNFILNLQLKNLVSGCIVLTTMESYFIMCGETWYYCEL